MAWRHFTWIEGPHRLSIMQCPDGSNLDRDIAELRDQGVDVLASALEPEEAAGLGLGDDAVQQLSRARGFPVPETQQQLRWVANLPRGSSAD